MNGSSESFLLSDLVTDMEKEYTWLVSELVRVIKQPHTKGQVVISKLKKFLCPPSEKATNNHIIHGIIA